MVRLFEQTIGDRVEALDFLVALGTHPPMSDTQLGRLVGQPGQGQADRSKGKQKHTHVRPPHAYLRA